MSYKKGASNDAPFLFHALVSLFGKLLRKIS